MCERVPYSTTLNKDILKKLKIIAIEEDRNANDVIEEALKEYFNKKK